MPTQFLVEVAVSLFAHAPEIIESVGRIFNSKTMTEEEKKAAYKALHERHLNTAEKVAQKDL